MTDVTETPESTSSRNRIRVTFAIYFGLILGLSLWSATSTAMWDRLQWESNASNWIIMAMEHLGLLMLRDVVIFLPLAFLCAAAIFNSRKKAGWGWVFVATAIGFYGSLILSLLLKSIMAGVPWHVPSVFVTALLIVICMIGSWAGASWVHLRGNSMWLLLQVVPVTVITISLVFTAGSLALESNPIPITPTPVQARERIDLVRKVQTHAPQKLAPNETTALTLSELDLNKLLTWGLSLLPRDQSASLEIHQELISFSFSEVLPEIPFFANVLNIKITGVPLTKRGELGILPREIRIGKLTLPPALLRWSGPIVIDKDWHHTAAEPFFAALRSVDVEEGQVTISYGHLALPDGFLNDALVGMGVSQDVGPAIGIHVENLFQLARKHEELSFPQCVQFAFTEAAKRSSDGQAVQENRAAFSALGYVLGHPSIRRLAGSHVPDVPPDLAAKFRRVTIHNRRDWAQHFSVSAALVTLSNATTSNAIGQLKEELDADGGSGFSFADLLADHAGTRLATVATQSEQSARKMQERLSNTFTNGEIMPDASDLPEGMTYTGFVKQYGGAGDPRYKTMVDEIDQRIAACVIYQ